MFQALKDFIAARVYANGNNEISGTDVRESLDEIVDILGTHTYKGQAIPTTSPSSEDRQVYSASMAGTYTNFDLIEIVEGEVCFLKYDGVSWEKIILVDITSLSVDVEVDGTSVFGSGVIGDELSALWATDGNNVKISRFGNDLMSLIYKDNSGGSISPESPEAFQVLSIAGGKNQPTIIMDGDENTGIGLIGGINSPFDGTPIPLRLAVWIDGTIRLMVGADGIRVTSLIPANDSTDTPTNFLFADAAGNVYRKSISSLSGGLTEEKAYVSDIYGDDVTGEYGKSGSPFKTVDAAISAMREGGTLVILDGIHDIGVAANVMFNIDCHEDTVLTIQQTLFPNTLAYNGNLTWEFGSLVGNFLESIANDCDVNGNISVKIKDVSSSSFTTMFTPKCKAFHMEVFNSSARYLVGPDCNVATVFIHSATSEQYIPQGKAYTMDININFKIGGNFKLENNGGVIATTTNIVLNNANFVYIESSSNKSDRIYLRGNMGRVSLGNQDSANIIIDGATITDASVCVSGNRIIYCGSVLAKSSVSSTIEVRGNSPIIDIDL